MGVAQQKEKTQVVANISRTNGAREIVLSDQSKELVFCVVGHIGSGTSEVAKTLDNLLQQKGYDSKIVKASDLITERSTIPNGLTKLQRVEHLQDAGDDLRKNNDSTIISRLFISKIRQLRAQSMGVEYDETMPVNPDGNKRAFILDSVKHPQEIEMLRRVYRNSFVTIGVVCDEEVRTKRIKDKLDINTSQSEQLMKRDSKDGNNNNGQHVAAAFHLSDFFLDNTENEQIDGAPNPEWLITDHLARLVSIITHEIIVRPTLSETGMFHAHGARLKSACLSRQVGAALVDEIGEVISTGKNEVPKAGGGTYSDTFLQSIDSSEDGRCYRKPHHIGSNTPSLPYCSNDTEKDSIIDEIVEDIKSAENSKIDSEEIKKILKNSRISSLIEFSRAIHAEMDAVLSALRQGKSITGSRLFVTTFPCHYCARHIVTSGVDEVQYIEPYPKSLAYKLHRDSIALKLTDGNFPSQGGNKVIFKPFVGVAPRLYQRAFMKDRDLKDNNGILHIGSPEWGVVWATNKMSIGELEKELANGL